MATAIASPLLAGSRIAAPASAPWRQGAPRGRISIRGNYNLYSDKNSRARDAFRRAAEYLQMKRQGKLDRSPITSLSAEEKNDQYEFKEEDEEQEQQQQEEEKQEAVTEGKGKFGGAPEEGENNKLKVKIYSKEGVAVREAEPPKNWMLLL